MEKTNFWGSLALGVSVSVGIAIAGLSMSYAFMRARKADRIVTVKGLAERNVNADMAVWPMGFKEAGNDLAELNTTLNEKREIITRFLLDSGFKESELSLSPPSIRDYQAEPVSGDRAAPKYRYSAHQTVSVCTDKVDLVKQTMEKSGDLVGRGVVLVSERGTEFLFTGLNEIKPAMIAEATQNARKAAEQFAEDSGSRVGKIRNARQGLFTINVRDRNSPEYKVVRVVTTVEYFIH
jgi:hypothetical protein